MTSMQNWKSWIGGALLLTGLQASALAADPAGKVSLLTGSATALDAGGTVRKLTRGDDVFPGDLINSGPGSYVNLHFIDGAYFLLRPDTRFVIEDFRYTAKTDEAGASAVTAPAGAAKPATPATAPLVTAATGSSSSSRAFFRLVKGGFRSVSGLIGKINQDDYRVSTPVATIGIRGTRYSARLCQGDCADRSEITGKLRAAGKAAQPGETILITTVEEGSIAIQTETTGDVQLPGEVRLVGEDGAVTPTETAPTTEQQDSAIAPDSCG